MEHKSTTIFINPKFKNAYINPNFLVPASTTIHVNPKFLNQQVITSVNHLSSQPPLPPPRQQIKVPEPPPLASTNKSAIIKNTKRSLIRVQEKLPGAIPCHGQIQAQQPKPLTDTIEKKLNLIKISNTKLVNASQLMSRQQKENETIKKATESLIKAKKLQQKKANGQKQSIYRLDRRKEDHSLPSPVTPKKKRKIIQQYSIRSVDQAKSVVIKKKDAVVINPKLLKTFVNNASSSSSDRKKYSLVMKKAKSKKTSKTSAQMTENRYFDKDVVNASPSKLLKNIPERSKKAPVLPDFIKI